MFCRNCGIRIPGDSVFCHNCGVRAAPTTEPAIIHPGAAVAPANTASPMGVPAPPEETPQDPPPSAPPPPPAVSGPPSPMALPTPGRTAYAVVDSPGMSSIRAVASGAAIVATALAIAGSLVAWVSLDNGFDTFSANGFDYGYITDWGDSAGKDGIIIVVLGLAIGLLGAAQFTARHPALPALTVAAGIATVTTAGYIAIETVSDLRSERDVSTSQAIDWLGAGLYLVIAGGIVAVVSGIVGLIAAHNEE